MCLLYASWLLLNDTCCRTLFSQMSMPLCAADKTCQYVRQLLEPAFTTVPAAVDIPALFQSALDMSGTLPFPVPDVFYESQRLQNQDMQFYLAPVSKSGAITFSSAVHTVLCKQFPAGTEMVQAGLLLTCTVVSLLVHCMGYHVCKANTPLACVAAGDYVNCCSVSALYDHILH